MTPIDYKPLEVTLTLEMEWIVKNPGRFESRVREFCKNYPQGEYFHSADVNPNRIIMRAAR